MPKQKAPAVKTTSKTDKVEKVEKTAAPVVAPVAAPAKKVEKIEKAAGPVAVAGCCGGMVPEERHKMVAEAAYYIALRKGFNSDPAENWAEAEAEIDAQLKKPCKS
jgi:hypothetical protein